MIIEYARFTPTPAFIRPENKSNIYIEQNKQLFIQEYNNLLNKYMKDADNNSEEYRKKKDCFEAKVCDHCGGTLRYIEQYDFWGCSNYREPGLHRNFTGLNPGLSLQGVNVDPNWVSQIINKTGFKGKVKAKELFEFYVNNEFKDMRLLYGLSGTEDRIKSLIKTKKRSQEQELKALKFLQGSSKKVVYQQCITYKLQGKNESFCIPDFICGADDSVLIVDAKLDYVDDKKMDLYISLVEHVLEKAGDKRPVTGAHIMYGDDNIKYVDSKHLLIILP